MLRILIVEDEKDLRELFTVVLNESGYMTLSAKDGIEAFEILDENHVDLIITDIMMPRMHGLEMVESLREAGYDMPILVITAKDASKDKKKGFDLGIDDYMVKPIDVNEMVWRVEALLRRSKIATAHKLKIGKTVFDRETLEISTENDVKVLVQKEFMLLFKLASSPNRIFTRKQIMDEIWGIDTESDTHTLDVHISRLREKFRDNEDFEIITARGLGYKLTPKKS